MSWFNRKYHITISLGLLWLFLVGIRPNGSWFQNIIGIFNTIGLSFIVYLLFIQFIYCQMNLPLFFAAFETFFLIEQAYSKIYFMIINKRKLASLLEQLPYFWKWENINEMDLKKDCQKTQHTMKFIIFTYIIFSFIVMTSFAIRPFLTSGYTLALNVYIPESIGYRSMLIIQTYFCFILCFSIAGFDILVCSLCFLLTNQFKILGFKIQNLNVAKLPRKKLHKELKLYINHHQFLLRYIHLFNQTFSNIFFLHVMYIMFSLCCELYMVSIAKKSSEIFRCIIYSYGIMVQMFLLHCIPAQALANEAEKIPLSIYSMHWYCDLSNETKQYVQIMLRMSQTPVFIQAGKFFKINYETCMFAFKTSLSFYMSITTIGSENKVDF